MEKIIHVLYTLNCGFKYIYIEREKEINNVGMKNLYETKKKYSTLKKTLIQEKKKNARYKFANHYREFKRF